MLCKMGLRREWLISFEFSWIFPPFDSGTAPNLQHLPPGISTKKSPYSQFGRWGEIMLRFRTSGVGRYRAVRAALPNRVSMLHTGGFHQEVSTNMQQRVQILYRRQSPSSARQLPIMAALHAKNLTLFVAYLTRYSCKSKYPFYINENFSQFLRNFSAYPPIYCLRKTLASSILREKMIY